jgi:iron complex transport system permease protein
VSAVVAERRSRTARAAATVLLLAAVVGAAFIGSIAIGSTWLDPVRVVRGVLGDAADPGSVFIVRELRLPRAIAALLVGAALGLAGALFQRVLANPLAAPDLIGISAASGTAVVLAILFGTAATALPVAALAGAGVGATLIALLARRGDAHGGRFILIGIGVAAFAESITGYLVSRADFSDARAATTWLIGSVGAASPAATGWLAAGLGAASVASVALERTLRAVELGPETAAVLGTRSRPARVALLGAGVVLVALATAVAGPIAFVGLLATPLSNAVLGSAGPRLWAAAATGALIVQLADLVAQHALPWQVSTGVVTGAVGAPYIAWLVLAGGRRRIG